MKHLGWLLLVFLFLTAPSASADWRWLPPKVKRVKMGIVCQENHPQCVKAAKQRMRMRYQQRIKKYHKQKLKEWKYWTSKYIPTCTWLGESGPGPEFAKFRYSIMNRGGSGARGKFQFMTRTYHAVAKYHDWSPLDQEISVRRLYWLKGTQPWSAC